MGNVTVIVTSTGVKLAPNGDPNVTSIPETDGSGNDSAIIINPTSTDSVFTFTATPGPGEHFGPTIKVVQPLQLPDHVSVEPPVVSLAHDGNYTFTCTDAIPFGSPPASLPFTFHLPERDVVDPTMVFNPLSNPPGDPEPTDEIKERAEPA